MDVRCRPAVRALVAVVVGCACLLMSPPPRALGASAQVRADTVDPPEGPAPPGVDPKDWERLKAVWGQNKAIDQEYQQRYYLKHPERFGKLVLHHAIPQKYWKPENPCHGVLPAAEQHALDNLRGILKGGPPRGSRGQWVINNRLHLSKIDKLWNAFDRRFITADGRCTATADDFYRQRDLVDRAWDWIFAEGLDKLPPEARQQRLASLWGIGELAFGLPHQSAASRVASDNLGAAFFDGARAGGIDFSKLELRYLSIGRRKGDVDVDYAFRAGPGAHGTTLADGFANAKQASNAFYVWLALPRSALWVNLKPNEPDKIMDPRLARTSVGRVMLEADLTLKKQAAWAVHPKRPVGMRFWKAIGRNCVPGARLWITPGVAQIHETGNELYILDAPLDVKVEQWDYHPHAGDPRPSDGFTSCPGQAEADQRRIVGEYERIVLPYLKKQVNTAPEFAALRRVYLSRIAAEWYRERVDDGDTAFAGLVDSGKIDDWADAGAWLPTQTFQRYVKSFTEGEYRTTKKWVDGNVERTWTVQVGGVNFALVPRTSVDDRTFRDRWSGLGKLARQGAAGSAVDRHTGQRWMGGRSEIDEASIQRSFPAVSAPGAATPTRPPGQNPGDLARAAAPYLVVVLVLAALALLGLAVLRRHRTRHEGANR
jgi:hypothetical protein